ncbi:MAG: IS200/IS605 family transposase [Phycisphaerales bacterium]|nr:IS200/IS605 family transposase [Phycisphaerales bacterium]MCB9864661.1 IS200/IS605 family transposase [Phycisphaerales bacterium]
MPGTYSHVVLHVVFSTKERAPFIQPQIQSRLYDYMGGILRSEKGVLYAIGGMSDHVHLLFKWRTDRTIADGMRSIKAGSSGWVRQTFPDCADFRWQEGYAVFSVSKPGEADVKAYIQNLEDHHRRRTFQEELLAFLDAHGVDYDPKYVFE